MKKLVLIGPIAAVLFSGCGIHDKISVVTTCEEGLIVTKLYQENFVSKDKNIAIPSNLRRTGVVLGCTCKKKEKGKDK